MSDSDDDIFKKKKPSKKKIEQQQKQKQPQQVEQQPQQLKQELNQPQQQLNIHKNPKVVIYCKVCTFPVEFCSYSKAPQECKEWLKTSFKDLYANLYPEDLKLEQEKQAAQQQPQQEQQQQQQGQPPEKKKKKKVKVTESEMVYIKVKERNRSKFITTLTGLEKHGLDIKEAQKKISKKFGCGSSINEKGDIELQGDLSAELEEWLPKEYPTIKEDMIAIQEK
ncbi:unnamed protein product (macronuclear) [Paramecium tetraurelia]|uniref:Chromosome undetermined scaffold_1, whole genome shotgun sequence n=1 Tax=Paramecium tetraurelia TaxID=5888 RepID=Q6BFQ6_PARTE|nr:hypothetical protein [Paramecium tetraurelia strain d4-2]XP_001423144.1 uncharacterized protein GSPATT00000181001 [Paramecium tetraurelia]CAH03514.1 Conserved hypothetical protein, translation initiation domain [Paramecium tetraurelia]CAK55746.1 unnamed protein product [Paramecium tetraurelia]|eukprot:XP_001423144.1 hypothetical protein (macronuclear) [Paramecium tetraurelia strain d4-2]